MIEPLMKLGASCSELNPLGGLRWLGAGGLQHHSSFPGWRTQHQAAQDQGRQSGDRWLLGRQVQTATQGSVVGAEHFRSPVCAVWLGCIQGKQRQLDMETSTRRPPAVSA